MYRHTYVEVNLDNIKNNIKKIISNYDYKYYFGVVKADCYGHGIKAVDAIIKGGVNYLAVATLEEAIEIRNIHKDIPILCLGLIYNDDIEVAVSNNITISITSLDYLKSIDINKLKTSVHIKINTGMNRLGVSSKEEFNEVYKLLNDNNILIEGIYSHVYNASSSNDTLNQFNKFEEITSDIDLSNIRIVHIQASDALTNYESPSYVNGCRLGIIMYGFNDKLDLLSTFKVKSSVIQINKVNGVLGYNGIYHADNELIAVIPIGYADGVIRKNTGRGVYINNKKYNIVGNICMDMLFVKVDDSIKMYDVVEIIKDNHHIMEISKYLDTIPYEIMCEFGKRVPRVYIGE